MNTRQLKWLTVILPILFGILLLIGRDLVLGNQSVWYVDLVFGVILVIGAVLFSSWVFGLISQRESEIERQTIQLASLHEASLVLGMDLDLGSVLNRVVKLAQKLVNARYGALGVLAEDGNSLERFITSGFSTEIEQQMGSPPQGLGILGVVIEEGETLRIDNVQTDPRRAGMPKHHPPMISFLGVPIRVKGRVIGNLYLTDKFPERGAGSISPVPFTEEDARIVEMFASQAAIAIENAQLYRKTQQLAVLEERERIGMDLHDGIIQSIYAVGLTLEDAQHRLKLDPDESNESIQTGIYGLNEIIRDIRNYILDLRPERLIGRDLQRGVEELVRDLKANSFIDVDFSTNNVDFSVFTPEQTVEILYVIREALNNIRRHARALHVDIEMVTENGRFETRVSDDGVGVPDWDPESMRGNGIRNMKSRATSLGGELTVGPGGTVGTVVILIIPVKASTRV